VFSNTEFELNSSTDENCKIYENSLHTATTSYVQHCTACKLKEVAMW